MTAIMLDEHDIRGAVTMPEAIAAVRRGFADLADGAFEMPVRTVLDDGGFLVMPVHHRPTSSAVTKFLSLNFDRAPAIDGTVVWSEAHSTDRVVAHAGTVTALRTGAAVGAATDLLADPGADELVLIGAGGQAPDQVRAVHAVRPLRRLTVVATAPERARALVERLRPELDGVRLETAADARAAVGGAPIVCCATTSTVPLFTADDLPERVHVNAIGAFRPTMRELPDDLLAGADVVIDEREAALEESGEVVHALEAGAITGADLTELGPALAKGGGFGPRTVFKSVGVAIQDWAVAHLLAERVLR
ncbi:ornithine cyclodeaminase family protein [Nocardiopsis suaedae]|uniref:Ornithine cyclodeaminase family protein n=1 Tax=Nocardiopsis suaedae TaxID=3018444 RepID=A0ABT4TR55_9ACTN|nr:ornithine cyclodeaminase family protein [Nocardiopsis suaedae]MDA2806871.1 ornithine cyclodeaminase family protein [Nocardiopsis suaedae]